MAEPSTATEASQATVSEAADTDWINVEVVYAAPERAWRVSLRLPFASTALQAFEASGLRDRIAALSQIDPDLGVFSHPVPGNRVLRDGDRVEVYRPLSVDPKDARRRRAAQR